MGYIGIITGYYLLLLQGLKMAICKICNKELWNNQTKRFSYKYCIGSHITETEINQSRYKEVKLK